VDAAFLSLLGAMFGEEFLQDFRRKRPAAFIDLMIAFESRHAPPSPHPLPRSSIHIGPPFFLKTVSDREKKE
jgi:hypothetical protein